MLFGFGVGVGLVFGLVSVSLTLSSSVPSERIELMAETKLNEKSAITTKIPKKAELAR